MRAIDWRTSASTSANDSNANGGRMPVCCSIWPFTSSSENVSIPQPVWWTRMISFVPRSRWEIVSDRHGAPPGPANTWNPDDRGRNSGHGQGAYWSTELGPTLALRDIQQSGCNVLGVWSWGPARKLPRRAHAWLWNAKAHVPNAHSYQRRLMPCPRARSDK